MARLRDRLTAFGMQAAIKAGRLIGDPLSGFQTLTGGREPYDYYDHVRRRGQLARSRVAPMVWFAAGHESVSTILRDSRFGKIPPGFDTTQVTLTMLSADPPDHTRLR